MIFENPGELVMKLVKDINWDRAAPVCDYYNYRPRLMPDGLREDIKNMLINQLYEIETKQLRPGLYHLGHIHFALLVTEYELKLLFLPDLSKVDV